jgi:hypothetical protein
MLRIADAVDRDAMRSSASLVLLVAAASLLGERTASAHHSVAFYSNEIHEIEGELMEVVWQNPHVRFTVRSTAGSDAGKLWLVESSSIFLRQRDGVTRDLFRTGDRVKVAGRRSPRDDSALLGLNMLLPDGREALLWPEQPARFAAADRLIRGSEQAADAAAENKGIFRVWLPPVGQASPYAGLPFRDTAIAARRSFDILAFAQSCEPEGMPRIAVSIFPYEFVDRGREILLRTELYDTERTIHLDRAAPPAGQPHSKLGYSVGEWRDGDLIVTTTLVNWRYFDNVGTPQSADVRIVERFALSADQSRLDVEMTVVDAATFTAPAVLKTYWQAYAGDINRYDCQADTQRAD